MVAAATTVKTEREAKRILVGQLVFAIDCKWTLYHRQY